MPPNLNGIWGALLFNVYRAQRQERIVQAEMVGLIDRAQSSLVALAEAVVLIDDNHQIEWWNPAAERLLGIQPLDRGRNILTILRQPAFIEYFHQAYYDKNKAAYFKHELIKNLYTCDNENVLKLGFLDKSINNNHLTDVEIDALNRLLHQQKERQLNFQQLIKKLHQLSILTLLKDSKNNQIENEKEAKIIYNQQQQYEEKVQQAMKQLKILTK